jgi:hypothetical protein
MIKHRVVISVTKANDTVLKLKNLTVKNLILNLLLGTKLMLLVPGKSVEMVSIKEVEVNDE